MRQAIKITLLACAVMAGLMPSAWAYSLGGPIGNNPNPNPSNGEIGDSWQQGVIGYGLPGDMVAPKDLGDEYRRNLPVLYYAVDSDAFYQYFGTNGAAAIDAACAILNNSFTNNPTGTKSGLNGYSANLVEFPLDSMHFNYEAQALGLWDLKSVTLGAFMEQFGLADPVRYAWTLHDRFSVGPLPCPADMEYFVVQRNFDIISSPLNQLQASPYVNNTLYSYQIFETCGPVNPFAVSVPYSVDPLADVYSPVASSYGGEIYVNTTNGLELAEAPGITSYGAYYTGLTRDDVAGLRYLLSTNNWNTENPDPSSLLFTISTNTTQQLFPPLSTTNQLGTNQGFYYFDGTFGYGDYGWLVATSLTNSPAALQTMYPGLQIITSASTNYFVYITNWIYTQYFTNPGVGSTYPPPLTLVTASNKQVTLQERFFTVFANVFSTNFHSTTVSKQQIITVTPNVGAPYGSPPVTNVTTKTVVQNIPSGQFFLLTPFYTNYCPLDILRVGLTNVNYITNILTTANTNLVTPTNTSSYSSTLIQVYAFTNYTYVIDPVTCTNSTPVSNLYQGIAKIQLVRSSYDSLLSQEFEPITNYYTLTRVSNDLPVLEHYARVVTTPDFLFSAEDLTTGPSSTGHTVYEFDRNVTFFQGDALSGHAGPGTIVTPTIIYFNESTPVFVNGTATFADVMDGTPFFNEYPGTDLADTFYSFYFVWASYDGTTNAPVVYDNGTSVDGINDQVLFQVTTAPPGPLVGSHGAYYRVTFYVNGGAYQMPYSWSGSGLPPGLYVTSNPDNSATISGTPTQSGTFNFTLTLTDSLGRTAPLTYSITIQ